MTSLTEVMYKVRLSLKVMAFGIIGLIIAWNAGKIFYHQWLKINPPPPPPPTVYYGPLPKIDWPKEKKQKFLSQAKINYKIPSLKERQLKNQIGYVFAYLKNRVNIWGPAELAQTASIMGFSQKEGRLQAKPTWIKFYNQDKTSYLTINEVNGYFDIQTDNSQNLNLSKNAFITDDQVTNFLTAWLKKTNYWTKDLIVDNFNYYYFLNRKLIKVNTIGDAQIIEVDYKRHNIAKRPIIFADNQPVASFWLGKIDNQARIIKAKFRYRPIYIQKSATYPLISASNSWQYLNQNKGLIINLPSASAINVDRVELGFYDSPGSYKYMFPIYIFKSSTGNFLAISSALPEKWLPL